MGEILQAAHVMTRRKIAANGGHAASCSNDEAVIRRSLSGLDLDYREAAGIGHQLAHQLATELVARPGPLVEICPALNGMWIDGLATGVLLEQRRRLHVPAPLADAARHVGYLATLHQRARAGSCQYCEELITWAATTAAVRAGVG